MNANTESVRHERISAASGRPKGAPASPLVIACLPVLAMTGCYVMPVGPDASGNPQYVYSTVPVVPGRAGNGGPVAVATGPVATVLDVKLYPINDLANQTGLLTGQVTNMMNGKGRFSYQGDTLVGEATRVANDERRGMATAYGPRGIYARCEYQMSSPAMGAGTCTFSNNAMYQVHIGK